jgi:hypothetical protein
MSETTSTDATADNKSDFTPITTQDEFNKAIADRLTREKAKFADYAELKKKADQLDKIEEANRTELDKEKARADAAESERDQIRGEKLRLEVAAKHGITGEYLDLLTGSSEEELEAKALKVAALIPDPTATVEPAVRELVVSGEGKSPVALNSDALTSMLEAAVGASPGSSH